MSKASRSEQERRRRHIQEMKEKLERMGHPPSLYGCRDLGSESEERFLEHILAFEQVDEAPLFDLLVQGGVLLPDPDGLDDEHLPSALLGVIHAMALLGTYLHSTDHLSDRKLYEHLWRDVLREPTTVMPKNPGFACHIDILGGCSEEDIQLYLKYYADEEYRRDWAKRWPDDVIPAHEDPPYDRDRHLPQAPTSIVRTPCC